MLLAAFLFFQLLNGAHAAGDFFTALHCGNFVCEPRYREDSTNCPIDCSLAEIRSYNSQVICGDPGFRFTPESAAEIQAILKADALKRYSVRVAGAMHSGTSLYCSNDILISTAKLDRIIGLRFLDGERVVDVEPGVRLGTLQEWLHERGYSLGFAVTNYPFVTIAGGISTASHGSSRLHPASFASLVREVTLVNAKGESWWFNRSNSTAREWNAVRVTLGSLGVITKLSLRVIPQFNLNYKTAVLGERVMLGRYPQDWPKACDTETWWWFPRVGKTLRFCGQITDLPEEAGARNATLLQQSPDAGSVELLRKTLHFSRASEKLGCATERFAFTNFLRNPPFQKYGRDGKLEPSNDVTGPSHRMVTTAFPDPNQRFHSVIDWALAVPAHKVQAVMRHIQDFAKKRDTCFPLAGIALRFVNPDGTLLGPYNYSAGQDPAAAILLEFVTYDPQRIQGPMREKIDRDYNRLITDLVELFGARPHWGKNADWVLVKGVESGLYGEALNHFLQVKRELDPKDRFGNELTRRLFKRSEGLDCSEGSLSRSTPRFPSVRK